MNKIKVIIAECEYCSTTEGLQNYYGATLCQECIDFDKNFDVDSYEADKRERIAEENEY